MRPYLLALIASFSCAIGAEWTDYFDFENIPNPPGIDPQVGGMGTLSDGRIAVVFHRGELMFYDSEKKSWSLFASGLQEPLGLLVESDSSILVMQRAELTRLKDEDGDGTAEIYETVYDDFGMSGNYHEFSYGPARDKDGNLYVALGLASNGAPMRSEIRGDFSDIGKASWDEMITRDNWLVNKKKAERMYARTNYRGWIMKIAPDGKVTPYASGLRSPNGISFDAKGRLLVTDNQGDWRPTSPLYMVKKGEFYGHPASLVWKEGWGDVDPYDIELEKLDAMQTPPIGFFPHAELANSPTQAAVLPKGAVPSFMENQSVIGDMNQPMLARVLEDEVAGNTQVALTPIFLKSPLGKGNNRITFGKDGSIYAGKSKLSWAGGTGIVRVKWNGKSFFSITGVKALKNGFDLTFSEEIAPKTSISDISIRANTYRYSAHYGSPKVDEQLLTAKSVSISRDGKTLRVICDKVIPTYLHAIDFSKVKSSRGESLLSGKAWYMMNAVPK